MNSLVVQEAIPYVAEADSFHFGGAFRALAQAVRTYWWVVLATAAVTVALVGLYIWIWPPVYEAEVIVAVDSDKDVQRTAFYQGWNIFRKEALTDEGVLMTSTPVLKEVVKRLHLRYEDVYHPFTRYALHLWTESWLGRNWRAFKQWLFNRPDRNPLLSPEEIEFGKVLRDMEAGVAVKQIGEASIGVLSVRASTPHVADIANAIVQVYLEQRRERYVSEATQAYESLAQETAKTKADLDALGQRVRDFRARTGTVLLFEKDKGQINQWLAVRGAINDLRVVIEENQASLKVVQSQLDSEAENLQSDRMYKVDAQKERLPKLEQALAAALQTYQPTSREVREIQEQIAEAHRVIAGNTPAVVRNSARISENYEQLLAKRRAIQATLQGARSALKVREEEMARMNEQLERIPGSMQTSHALELEQTNLETKYAGLSSKLAIAAVSMATALSAPAAMRVVEPAHAPEQAAAPQSKLLILAALVGGAMLGALLALMLDLISPRATRARLLSQQSTARLLGVVSLDNIRLAHLLGGRPMLADAAGRST